MLLDAQAEAKLVPHTPTTKTSAVVTVDHAKNSQMESLEPSVLNDQYLIRETPTQTVAGSADVTEFDYDHCHFNESHQHHHCYEAEEHTHEESSAYTNYRTSRPTRRYYTSTNHHRSYRHSAYEHASRRYAEHKRRDSWNAIALGLAIGLPLAYSHNHLDRGRYGSRYRGHRNGSYHVEAIMIEAIMVKVMINVVIVTEATRMGAAIGVTATSDSSYNRNGLSLPRQNASIARLS